MNERAIKSRIVAVCRLMREKRADGLIVERPANVTYLTGFSGDDSWAAVTRTGRVYLLTDSRYTEQAQSECSGCRIIERKGTIAEAAGQLAGKLKLKTTAVEDSASLAVFETLRKNVKGRLKSVGNIIESVRSIKDSSEIAAVKTASRLAARALQKTIRYIRQGVSENELAGRLDFEIRKLGAVNGFDTIAAFGASASRPHHQPGRRKLRKNDTILIDFGVRYKNYCCDLTRCFVVGRAGDFYKKVYNAVKEAQAAAIKMVKPGVEIARIDAAARGVINRYKLPVYGHGTGHGLGLEVHEQPVISVQSKGKLQAGMVFTIEPAVYIPGKLGIRIEDNVLVTETGYQILTHNCPHQFLLTP